MDMAISASVICRDVFLFWQSHWFPFSSTTLLLFFSEFCSFSTCFYKIGVYQQRRSDSRGLAQLDLANRSHLHFPGDTLDTTLYVWFSQVSCLSGQAGSRAPQECSPSSSSLKCSLTNHLPASLGAICLLTEVYQESPWSQRSMCTEGSNERLLQGTMRIQCLNTV